MKNVAAYKCDFCGKLFQRCKSCIKHEKICTKNPNIRPLCYDCEHYEASENKEIIEFYYDSGVIGHKPFSMNKCKVKGCKLFHDIKLSDNITESLYESGYEPMPTRKTGGCSDAKNY